MDAINLRREILSVLKPEDLVFPNDGADTSLAQLRYNFIAGIDNNKDSQDNIDSLGSFMALMTTSNLLREAVNLLRMQYRYLTLLLIIRLLHSEQ